jgi:hypothetical protein
MNPKEDQYSLMCRYCWEHLRRNQVYRLAGKEIRQLLLQHPMRFLAHCPTSNAWQELPKKCKEIAIRAASGVGLTFPPLDELDLRGVEITRKPRITKLLGVHGNYICIGEQPPPNLKGYNFHWRNCRLWIRQDGEPSKELLMQQIEKALEMTLEFKRASENGWETRTSSTGKTLKLPPEGWEMSLKAWDAARKFGKGKGLKKEVEKARRRINSSFQINFNELKELFAKRETNVILHKAILEQDKAKMISELNEKHGISKEKAESLFSS